MKLDISSEIEIIADYTFGLGVSLVLSVGGLGVSLVSNVGGRDIGFVLGWNLNVSVLDA